MYVSVHLLLVFIVNIYVECEKGGKNVNLNRAPLPDAETTVKPEGDEYKHIKDELMSLINIIDLNSVMENEPHKTVAGTRRKMPEIHRDIMLQLMRKVIYAARYKTKFVEDDKKMSADDPMYTLGFMYSEIFNLHTDLMNLFSALNWHEHWNIYRHVHIYDKIVHINVDITQMYERLIRLESQVSDLNNMKS